MNISNIFHQKYEQLYNSVSYNRDEMLTLKRDINEQIINHHNDNCNSHTINVQDVIDCASQLKCGKHDGNKGHYSDHIVRGTPRLHIYISLLFHSMVHHGFSPSDFLLSTLVPIPKNKRKSVNNSDNYRAIALSSILGKLLDKILLLKCNHVFLTSDLQYGFKKKHSTNQCTFVVNEIVQYYISNGSNVFLTLLDASRAFDRVQYVKLFRLLLTKHICPVVARFLTVLYTNQTFRVFWRF